jgi:hypothetical protein
LNRLISDHALHAGGRRGGVRLGVVPVVRVMVVSGPGLSGLRRGQVIDPDVALELGPGEPVGRHGLHVVTPGVDPVTPRLEQLEHAELHGVEIAHHAVEDVRGQGQAHVAVKQRQLSGRLGALRGGTAVRQAVQPGLLQGLVGLAQFSGRARAAPRSSGSTKPTP